MQLLQANIDNLAISKIKCKCEQETYEREGGREKTFCNVDIDALEAFNIDTERG